MEDLKSTFKGQKCFLITDGILEGKKSACINLLLYIILKIIFKCIFQNDCFLLPEILAHTDCYSFRESVYLYHA